MSPCRLDEPALRRAVDARDLTALRRHLWATRRAQEVDGLVVRLNDAGDVTIEPVVEFLPRRRGSAAS